MIVYIPFVFHMSLFTSLLIEMVNVGGLHPPKVLKNVI
jgi:hypothetical protein